MSFINHRPLVLAISARGISFLGDLVATVALTFRLAPHGAAAVSLLLACNLLPIVLLSDLAGRLADTLDERVVLSATAVAQAAVCAALMVAPSTAAVFALVALLGAGQALNGATWQALIPALVPPDRIAWALSRAQLAVTAAGVGAPALGGALVAATGTRVPLVVDVASFLVVAAAGLTIGRVRTEPAPDRDRTGGWRLVRRSSVLRGVLGLMGGLLLLGCMVNVVEVFLIRSVLHAGAVAYGACGAAYSAASLGGALWAGRRGDTLAQARRLVRGGATIGVGLALMGLAPTVGALLAASLVAGAANGVISVSAATVLLETASPDTRGRVAAVAAGVYSAAQLGSYGLAAGMSSVLGPRGIFVLGGLVGSLFALGRGRILVRAMGGTRRPGPALPARLGDRELAAATRRVSLQRVGGA